MTSSCAEDEAATRDTPAPAATKSAETSTPGKDSRTQSRADLNRNSRASSAAPCPRTPTRLGTRALGAASNDRRIPRSQARRAAHCSAACDPADPSTPTTTSPAPVPCAISPLPTTQRAASPARNPVRPTSGLPSTMPTTGHPHHTTAEDGRHPRGR